jgi:acyl-CoA synthetase (AMP-forming)/AMP-acid ligase II/acyl carrier protein
MTQDKTLIDTLQRVQAHSESGITLIHGSHDERSVSYGDLYTRARRVLHVLQQKGLRPRQELVLQVQEESVFLHLFWACLLGGIIPVPCTVGSQEEHRLKVVQIWSVLRDPMLAAEADTWERFRSHVEARPELREMETSRICTEELMLAAASDDAPLGAVYEASPQDIAFLQFSSGSTGDPKGVVLTHENVVTNLRAIVAGVRAEPRDSVLSWMPLTHDMGLIGMHLMALSAGLPFYLIPTHLFVRRPGLWLDKVSEHRVSLTSSPNFGYKLFLTTFRSQRAADWNLSSLRVIFNGAEPISYELCERFLETMAPYGLPRSAMFPVYGLAEATVGAAFPEPGAGMRHVRVDRRTLVLGETVVELAAGTDSQVAASFLEVGTPIQDVEIRICGEQGEKLAEMQVGRIQIRGKSVTQGYYNNAEATARALLADGWLDTGDLGFWRGERLVVTGRAKDILFVNGQNFYPHDVERAAEAVDGVELGKVAVTGVLDETLQRDRILVFVTYKHGVLDFAPLALAVKRCISRQMGLQVDHVLPVRAIPKTTSGKVQRYKLGEQFESGIFDAAAAELQARMAELERAEGIVAPRNEVEATILELWQAVLQRDAISVEDHFFELGGSSAMVAQIVGELEELYPGRVQIADPYALPTIRQMADHILAAPRTISLTPIPLPEKYLASQQAEGGAETLQARVGVALMESLRKLARAMQGTLPDLLALVFANLLAQVASTEKIELSFAGGGEGDRVTILQIDFSGVDLAGALHSVRDQRLAEREVCKFSDLLHGTRRQEEPGILAGFFHRETRGGQTKWLQVYDLLLQVEEFEDGLELACQFEGRRLQQNGMKELLTLYVRLLQHLAGKSASGREHHAETV